ncbi:SRPBCC family protein [Pseudonocardia sp. KRD291]|uniref:SRPBCC family protein n=1 Tax=Pseudonocardia sp. KRD291 TaxID=2792007 RepID=UPI001C49ED47|nr:SRPBCC family protein [Pseudonocardia sp. KRD291]MBW0100858.1 SRPBCC family protein [Pseudonocardia sp. KRD291]
MVEVNRTFQVRQPPGVVLEYLQDFSRAEEWDPGTVSCARVDSGPIQVGSRWKNVSKFMGNKTELTYELVQLDDERVVFRGENKSATATDDIDVRPGTEPGAAAVTYRAHIDFRGAAKLATPLAKVEFERTGDNTVIALTEALGRWTRA